MLAQNPDAVLVSIRAVAAAYDEDGRLGMLIEESLKLRRQQRYQPADLAATLWLNYPEFPDSSFRFALGLVEDVLQMLADGSASHLEQLSHPPWPGARAQHQQRPFRPDLIAQLGQLVVRQRRRGDVDEVTDEVTLGRMPVLPVQRIRRRVAACS